jgi:outer membrane protein assembly factor BamB
MATGHVLWKHLIPNQAFWTSLVCADDRLYATSQSGTTFVFAADPKEYRQLATNDMGEGCNATLAVSEGQIFLRTFKNLYCIEGK